MNYILLFTSYLLIFSTLFFSCSESELDNNTTNTNKNQKIISGDYCSDGCIWSSYAVNLNAQSPEVACNTGYCACVKAGDIYNSCSYETSVTSQSQEVNQNNNTTQYLTDIPYYNQYDNKHYGYATCQNTSVAMVLSYFEYKIHPDTIFQEWGKEIAKSPSGLNQVYSYYSTKSSIETYTDASPEFLREALRKGYIVIAHGYFTSSGHVIVITGFKNNKYYVNDPAGKWSECFKCGYSDYYNGVTSYHRDTLEAAVFTSNGQSYLPGWIHIIKKL